LLAPTLPVALSFFRDLTPSTLAVPLFPQRALGALLSGPALFP
jgi:hypothetical protein